MSAEAVDMERVAVVLLGVTWPDGGHDGMPTRKVAGMLATALLPLFAEVRAEGVEQGRGEVREQVTRLMLSRHDTQELSVRLPVGALRDALASHDPLRDAQEGRFVARVSSSEVSGPSGAGSRAESSARNPRRPSGIRLSTPHGIAPGVGSVDGRDGGGL